MTTTQDSTQKADVARGHTQEAASDAKSRAAEVGSHATDAAQDVKATALDQAQNVKQETARQARNLLSEATGQLSSQAGSQTQRLSGSIRQLGDELRHMADNNSGGGTATELAHQASERAHQMAGYLEGREPSEIMDDLRSYARQRPGAFLAGAAVLGLVVGRLGRGVKDAGNDDSQQGQQGYRPQTSGSVGGYSTPASYETPSTFQTPSAYQTSPLADGAAISSTTPLSSPPGETYEDDRTVDLSSDRETSLVDPTYGESEVGRR